jgi:DNA-binding transcriptional ArsR family regulator
MKDTSSNLPLVLIAKRMKAMAEPARLIILHSLCTGEKNVSELVEETGFSQSNISKHLRVLRDESLVRHRRERRHIYYSLTDNLSEEICNLISCSLEYRAQQEQQAISAYRGDMDE